VYKDVTLYIINSTKSLHVLVGDCVHQIDFPSWVANWGQEPKYGIWEWDEWKYDLIRSNQVLSLCSHKDGCNSTGAYKFDVESRRNSSGYNSRSEHTDIFQNLGGPASDVYASIVVDKR
jgi:hypothetical protein